MTPQELKNSILQLAIQGRLVEQRPEEGTAEELYRQIQAEKRALNIKENRNLENVAEDDIPFDIPENWRWVRFGEIVSYNMGKTPPRAEAQWWKPEFPWVSIADMPESGHLTETKECVSNSALSNKFGNKISRAGTMIMSFKLTVGRVSILGIDAVHNEAIISIYPFCDFEKVIQSYLFRILPLITQYGDSKNAIKGKTLNDTSLCNLSLPLPPFSEQKRIVAKIEELLPYIDRYEKAWSKLEDFNKRFPSDMQKSILQLAIQGKLVEQRLVEGTGEELYQQIQAEKQRLIKAGTIKKDKLLPDITDDEKPFDIPENWKWVRLGSITTKLTDGSHNPPPNTGRGYPVISAKNVKNGVITLENVDRYTNECGFQKENPRTNIKKNDIIMGIIGGSIGNVAVYTLDEKVIAQRSIAIIKTLIDTQYAVALLTSPLIQNFLQGAASGSAQGGVYLGTLGNLIIPLPPLAEQKRIVSKLEELLPLCEKLR